jgi:hypothetical protein
VLFMIYGLPQVLPDRVLAWLNVGVHDLGATGASSEMRSTLSSQARSPWCRGFPRTRTAAQVVAVTLVARRPVVARPALVVAVVPERLL